MNILFTEMEYHNLQWQVKLVEDGHTVYTTQTGSPNYLKTLNINSISEIEYRVFTNPDNYTELNNNLPLTHLDKLEQVIEKYKIDLIINTWPTFNSIIHKKDFGSRRGLLSMVGQRRNLLKYIKNKNEDRYTNLIKKLGLRR